MARLNQSGRHESGHILDETALQFCSQPTLKTIDVLLFFAYLHWKDKDLSMVVRQMPPGIGRANGFPDDRVLGPSAHQQVITTPNLEPPVSEYRKRKIREEEKRQEIVQKSLQLGISAFQHAQSQASGSSSTLTQESDGLHEERLRQQQFEVAQSMITRNLLYAEESKMSIAQMKENAGENMLARLRKAIADPSFKKLSPEVQDELVAKLQRETVAELLEN